jgi:hypothetical protein
MSGASKREGIEPALGIDLGWDEAAPPDGELSKPTAPPPAPGNLVASEPAPFTDAPPPMILGEEHEVHDEDEVHISLDLEPVEPKIDIAAASRAANTAAALGRAPKPATTMKMNAVQIQEAIARLKADEEEEKKKK